MQPLSCFIISASRASCRAAEGTRAKTSFLSESEVDGKTTSYSTIDMSGGTEHAYSTGYKYDRTIWTGMRRGGKFSGLPSASCSLNERAARRSRKEREELLEGGCDESRWNSPREACATLASGCAPSIPCPDARGDIRVDAGV